MKSYELIAVAAVLVLCLSGFVLANDEDRGYCCNILLVNSCVSCNSNDDELLRHEELCNGLTGTDGKRGTITRINCDGFAYPNEVCCDSPHKCLRCFANKDSISNLKSECKGTVTNNCGSCFPSDATVELANGKHIRMDQLTVGDSVRVSATKFSDVMIFSHNEYEVMLPFVRLETKEGYSIVLTASHYLYVNGKLAQAGTVQRGDTLITSNGTEAIVSIVTQERSNGLFNPHTVDGDIVVNGIVTSTYTTTVAPSLAHALLWPVRVLYNSGISFGSSGSEMLQEAGKVMVKYLPEGLNRYD